MIQVDLTVGRGSQYHEVIRLFLVAARNPTFFGGSLFWIPSTVTYKGRSFGPQVFGPKP